MGYRPLNQKEITGNRLVHATLGEAYRTVEAVYKALAEIKAVDAVIPELLILHENLDIVAPVGSNIQSVINVGQIIDEVVTVAEDITNVNTVAGSISSVNTVAGSQDKVNRVYDSIIKVDRVYDSISDVDTVSDSIVDVETVSGSISSVNIVAPKITEVSTTAGSIGNVNTVAGSITSVDTVAPSIGNVNTVAGSIGSVNTVSGDIDKVVTTANSIGSVNTVSGSISNVNIVAGRELDIGIVAGSIDSVNTTAGSITNVNLVADNETDISKVATSIGSVNAVATDIVDVGIVATNIGAVGSVASNETNVNAVAGIVVPIGILATNIIKLQAIYDALDDLDSLGLNQSNFLLKSDNLSGLTNYNAARTNLGLGTAAIEDTSYFATASQGTKADTAHSWGDHNTQGYLDQSDISSFATDSQGILAENAIPMALKGANNGVAELDASGLVPASQLPSYVDDVLEYTNLDTFPNPGESGKIYVAQNDNKIYRWSGSGYIEISPTAGNADSATKLTTARKINGTIFDGSFDITTQKWGTSRTIKIGNKSISIDGSTNATYTLNDIGALGSGHAGTGGASHADATTSTSGFMSPADKSKLNSIATGATKNASDASLRDRSTHTGTQPHTSITGLGSAATSSSTDFATAAQGTKAETAHSWGNHASAGYVMTDTTYSTNTKAQLDTGTDTAGKLQSAKNLHDWLASKGYVTTDTTYSAGNGLTLSGTAFSLPVEVSGSGTFVTSVTQSTNGITVNLGTPPNTNTTYSEISTAEIDAGTASTLRTISGRRMKYALDKKSDTSTQIIAGNGLSGGGSLASNRTITLGTPSEVSTGSTNSVASSSHTHALSSGVKASLAKADSALQSGDFGIGGGLQTVDPDTADRGSGFYTIGSSAKVVNGGTIPGWATYISLMRSTHGEQIFVRGDSLQFRTRGSGDANAPWEPLKTVWHDNNFDPNSKQDKLTAGSNVTISGSTISATNTTYSTGTLAQLNTGTDTSGRLHTAKNLNDWLNGKGYVTADTKYSAGSGLTLSGTTFSLPVTISGTGSYVQSVAQNTNGITVTLGTPPNTTYSVASLSELNTGTATTARTVSAKNLNDWVNNKNYASNSITITAGTGLSGGGTLAANRTLSVKYGTSTGTAAQGNDSRITGAMQKSSNLGDVSNTSTARSNLGLGTAATSNVVQSTGSSTTNVMSQKAVTDALVPVKTFAEAVSLTSDIGPIIVAGMDGIWEWVNTAHFTGYRHPYCGMWMDGWTPTPLPFQIEAIGGTWRTSDQKERRVIARYRESGLVVSSANWIAGENKIADLGSGNWKAPDLRNMFKRFTGTDADTTNARELGSLQQDAFRSHSHAFQAAINGGGNFAMGAASASFSIHRNLVTGATGGSETRPMNTAVKPYIHV